MWARMHKKKIAFSSPLSGRFRELTSFLGMGPGLGSWARLGPWLGSRGGDQALSVGTSLHPLTCRDSAFL